MLVDAAVAEETKGPSEHLVSHLQPNADAFATSSHDRGHDLQLSEPGSLTASETIHHLTPEINTC